MDIELKVSNDIKSHVKTRFSFSDGSHHYFSIYFILQDIYSASEWMR